MSQSSIERLREYLGQLPPKAQALLMREFEREAELSVHQLIAELSDAADWVLVEGFKECDLPKVEVWRAESQRPAQYGSDAFVVAIATKNARLAWAVLTKGDAFKQPA